MYYKKKVLNKLQSLPLMNILFQMCSAEAVLKHEESSLLPL